jgi:hypothetical protein
MRVIGAAVYAMVQATLCAMIVPSSEWPLDLQVPLKAVPAPSVV